MALVDDVNDLRKDVAGVKTDIKSLAEKVDLIVGIVGQQAGIIRGFEDERQRKIGADRTIKFLWGVLTAGMAGLAYALHDLLVYLFPHKVP